MEQNVSGKQWLTDALPELAYIYDGLKDLHYRANAEGVGPGVTGQLEMARLMLALLERKLEFFQRKYDFKVTDEDQVWPCVLVSHIDVGAAIELCQRNGAKPW